jgi:hypothetical protein
MSHLTIALRPLVQFDPSNKSHRLWVSEFLQYQTWSRCPVRFIVLDDSASTFSVVQRQLTEYYTEKEFGKTKVDQQDI